MWQCFSSVSTPHSVDYRTSEKQLPRLPPLGHLGVQAFDKSHVLLLISCGPSGKSLGFSGPTFTPVKLRRWGVVIS